MYVINRTRGTYLGVNVAKASTLAARMRGLYARRGLRLGDGLWLVPCTGVQTVGMGYAIDAVFLDAAQRVVRVYEALPPGRFIWWVPKSHSAIEMPVGAAKSSETQIGDQIEFVSGDPGADPRARAARVGPEERREFVVVPGGRAR